MTCVMNLELLGLLSKCHSSLGAMPCRGAAALQASEWERS